METKTDCTLLSARMSRLSGLPAFPTCISTILAAHHTNIVKNCTPKTNFQSSSESNKGQLSSSTTTEQHSVIRTVSTKAEGSFSH